VKGPGRPSKDEVAKRRERIRLFLVCSAAASDPAVKRIAEKLDVNERSLRGDLEAIREEIEHAPSDELTQTLLEAIEAADTFKLLKALGKRVMHEMVIGNVSRELGATLIDALREQRHALRSEREEDAQSAITALEILMPQEQELLKKYRESLVPAALKPGEFPPPPEGSVVPVAPKPPAPVSPTAGLPPSSWAS
jgi:hypothetical protein